MVDLKIILFHLKLDKFYGHELVESELLSFIFLFM